MKRYIHKRNKNKYKTLLLTSMFILVLLLSYAYGSFNTNINIQTKGNIIKKYWNFDYTGNIQEFTASKTGTYKLETWGAQGADAIVNNDMDRGGYGAYSTGEIYLIKGNILYIAVGGKGQSYKLVGDITTNEYDMTVINNGNAYNGGGQGEYRLTTYLPLTSGYGGGATSIQNELLGDGQLKNYADKKDNVVIVSSGGGAGMRYPSLHPDVSGEGGDGGGIKGNDARNYTTHYYAKGIGGTQTSGGTPKILTSDVDTSSWTHPVDGELSSIENWAKNCDSYKKYSGSFGLGGSGGDESCSGYEPKFSSGGGSGWYGGSAGIHSSGAGGSSYIGNINLRNKYMACYDCEISDETDKKTITVSCYSDKPVKDCSKKGNGYARITFLKDTN